MLIVSKAQLFQFLENGGSDYASLDDFRDALCEEGLLDAVVFDGLKNCDIRQIIAGSEMSENHLGGDELVAMADDVLQAVEDGYQIVTWYGPNTEALVAGYQEDELTIVS